MSGDASEARAERLDPRQSAESWAAQVLDACRRAAPERAEPCIVSVRLRVPSGQSPRRVERMLEAVRAESLPPEPAACRAWEALACATPVVIASGASYRYVILRVEGCTDRPPHGWGDFQVSAWPVRPPAAVQGALAVHCMGVLAPELRGMTRMVPGEETVLVGSMPLRLALGTGAGAQLQTPGVSGVLEWTPAAGWGLHLQPSARTRVGRRADGLELRAGGVVLRAHRFRTPLSPARAVAVAGRLPAVVVSLVGRVLPTPARDGGWGAPLHARVGAVLPSWAESSVRVGEEWLASDGTRVAWLPAGGGTWREGPAPGEVAGAGDPLGHDLPPSYLCGVRFAQRAACAYGTADRPVRVGGDGGVLGDDPYLEGTPLRVAPARSPRRALLALAPAGPPGRPAWIRDAPPGRGWTALQAGAPITVPLPAEVIAGTLWLHITHVPLDSAENE